jgi:hypothetical protein
MQRNPLCCCAMQLDAIRAAFLDRAKSAKWSAGKQVCDAPPQTPGCCMSIHMHLAWQLACVKLVLLVLLKLVLRQACVACVSPPHACRCRVSGWMTQLRWNSAAGCSMSVD